MAVKKKKAAPKKAKATKPAASKKTVKKTPVKKKVTAAKKPAPAKAKAKQKKVVAKKPVKKTVKPKSPAKKITAAKKPTVKKPAAKKKVTATPVKKKPVVKKPAAKKPVIVKKETKKQTGKPAIKTPVSVNKTITQSQPKQKRTALEKTRYSDKELLEFKALIIEKLESAKKELKYVHEQINRTAELGGDDSDNKFSGLEDGTGTSEKEYLSQMASRQITYIDHLEKALIRIANKTYGVCRVTGKLINKDRLRAVPHATLSIEAKNAQNASK